MGGPGFRPNTQISLRTLTFHALGFVLPNRQPAGESFIGTTAFVPAAPLRPGFENFAAPK
jgi:hypothetical protein